MTHHESCINEICGPCVRLGSVFIQVLRLHAEYFIFLSCWHPCDATKQGMSHVIGHFDCCHQPKTRVAQLCGLMIWEILWRKTFYRITKRVMVLLNTFILNVDGLIFPILLQPVIMFLTKQNDKTVWYILLMKMPLMQMVLPVTFL